MWFNTFKIHFINNHQKDNYCNHRFPPKKNLLISSFTVIFLTIHHLPTLRCRASLISDLSANATAWNDELNTILPRHSHLRRILFSTLTLRRVPVPKDIHPRNDVATGKSLSIAANVLKTNSHGLDMYVWRGMCLYNAHYIASRKWCEVPSLVVTSSPHLSSIPRDNVNHNILIICASSRVQNPIESLKASHFLSLSLSRICHRSWLGEHLAIGSMSGLRTIHYFAAAELYRALKWHK